MIGWWVVAGCGSPSGSAEEDTDPPGRGSTPTSSAVGCPDDALGDAPLLVAPFVQDVTPTSARIVWETASGTGSRVDFGPDEALGSTACGTLVPMFEGGTSEGLTQVHEVGLTGLAPDTVYVYTTRTGATTTEPRAFRTAPRPEDESEVHLVAMGDSQRDPSHPDKFREVVEDGVIPWATSEWDPDLSTAVDVVVLAGDLVDNGWSPDEWTDAFFAPAAELFARVPLYPVLGNHEGNSPLYFRYFHLPEGGDEHWYTVDRSNLRIVGLDSNPPFDDDAQLAWLDGVLDDTCVDPTIDFVFAQLHHPHRSELWPAGESDWSGAVVARLEQFSTDCGKPSVHFFGHTHGYSRGQSRDHRHLWVNVSSAGGALDAWGSTPQTNYPEFSTSQDTWGFVAVEVTAGDDPALHLRRVSRGTDAEPHDNAITDVFTLRRDAPPPGRPAPTGPAPTACGGPPVLAATPYDGGSGHQATHWQVAATCGGFDTPTVERWRQSEDRFDGVDTQLGDDLTDEPFPELGPGASGCWRVRYRSDALAWSAWSVPEPIALPTCP